MARALEKRGPRVNEDPEDVTEQATPEAYPGTGIERPNLWVEAAAGKVRPRPREPERTHYGCRCCRWSA